VSNPSAAYILFSTAIGSAQHGCYFGYDDTSFGGNDAADIQVFRAVANAFTASTSNASNTAVLSAYANLLTANSTLVSECAFDLSNSTAANRISLRVNGGSEIKQNTRANAPSSNNASFNFTLGNGVGGASTFVSPLQGDVCELMLFNQQPTAAARDLIRRYLGAKWGVAVA
jgi:hypothetical protein